MDKETIKKHIVSAVEEYLSTPEAWEDAVVAIHPDTGAVDLVDAEEAEHLPESIDEYDIMNFIRMTTEGEWVADDEAIDSVAEEEADASETAK